MNYTEMREELKNYYWEGTDVKAEAFKEKVYKVLEGLYRDDMTPYEMKALQYKVISDMFEPVIFFESPFYYETGTMWSQCDGSRYIRGVAHAGGWTYGRNSHLFREQDLELYDLRCSQVGEQFYLICGPYNDVTQHFNYDTRPVLKLGLRGLYEKAKKALETATEDEEIQYLNATCDAMLALKKMGEKYAEKAKELLVFAKSDAAKRNLSLIADTAARVPWEKPETFYEAINTYAFMRKAFGALDGVGPNTFGRMDMDLYPFYKSDIEKGIITKEQAYDYVAKFLLTWDMHFDHNTKMVGYADHELENTYVIGGCDLDGKPLYNDLTSMFLRATREETIIFPKITCRYNELSPKEYLDEINTAVINGTSTILYQNDNSTIKAMLKAGKTLEEARDYLITGCWAISGNGIEKIDDGCYVNILRVFETTIHNITERMEKTKLYFKPIDEAESFEEVYKIIFDNFMVLFKERARVVAKGGNIWNKVDPLPIFSSTLQNCIENKKDYTAGGAKYRDSRYELVGFPNVVDSLLAIKKLCFDLGKYTLKDMLKAIRCNWEGYEDMRIEAMHCPGWGDGSKESCEFAGKFNDDLYALISTLVGTYGGKIVMGHLTYTEIRFWGEKTLATPDGRFNGDYIAQGISPSRLKKIPSSTAVINSFKYINAENVGGNSVVNIILPNKVSLDTCEAFLRAAANSGMQSLQLNCTTKEQLLDAQKHPENYPELIVRVCGFSAKFTSLSPEWQQEILTRNFYD